MALSKAEIISLKTTEQVSKKRKFGEKSLGQPYEKCRNGCNERLPHFEADKLNFDE